MMHTSTMRDKILDELSKILDDKVSEIFDVIHYFRIGLGTKTTNPQNILKLAGSWNDLSEDDFNEFLEDVKNRRNNAFNSRGIRETSAD